MKKKIDINLDEINTNLHKILFGLPVISYFSIPSQGGKGDGGKHLRLKMENRELIRKIESAKECLILNRGVYTPISRDNLSEMIMKRMSIKFYIKF